MKGWSHTKRGYSWRMLHMLLSFAHSLALDSFRKLRRHLEILSDGCCVDLVFEYALVWSKGLNSWQSLVEWVGISHKSQHQPYFYWLWIRNRGLDLCFANNSCVGWWLVTWGQIRAFVIPMYHPKRWFLKTCRIIRVHNWFGSNCSYPLMISYLHILTYSWYTNDSITSCTMWTRTFSCCKGTVGIANFTQHAAVATNSWDLEGASLQPCEPSLACQASQCQDSTFGAQFIKQSSDLCEVRGLNRSGSLLCRSTCQHNFVLFVGMLTSWWISDIEIKCIFCAAMGTIF